MPFTTDLTNDKETLEQPATEQAIETLIAEKANLHGIGRFRISRENSTYHVATRVGPYSVMVHITDEDLLEADDPARMVGLEMAKLNERAHQTADKLFEGV